jgi:hypothetical protein
LLPPETKNFLVRLEAGDIERIGFTIPTPSCYSHTYLLVCPDMRVVKLLPYRGNAAVMMM